MSRYPSGRCCVCGAALSLPTEAARCAACQTAGRWPTNNAGLPPELARLIVAVPRHHQLPGWQVVAP